MKRRLGLVLLALSVPCLARAQAVHYGSNPAAGQTFTHDGVKLYYETYGSGEPLLLVHFNGGSIAGFGAQISHFRKHYRVIAMDSRGQGKSGDGPEKLTYEKMTDDLAALLDHVKVGPAYVLGWSDGAVEALLLAIRHPSKVKKIAAMAGNLDPNGLHPDVIAVIKGMSAQIPEAARSTPEGQREVKLMEMMLEEPHIEAKALEAITAPTLVLAGDHDIVRDEHTIEIYHHIPNSQLALFPNATHTVPFDDPVRFNATVEQFFRTPFVKRDRVKDAFESGAKMRAAEGKAP
jgi:pimeloyl-ACP methyl ester carboxylesterase